MSESTNTSVAAPDAVPSAVVNAPSTTEATPISVTPSQWTDGLNEDLKGYVGLKGFKDPGAVVESYRNFEKLMGVPQDRILKFPDKVEDPTWNDIYKKLGKPETVDGYKIPMPKEGGDESFVKAAAEVFHKANLTQAQAEALSTWWNSVSEGAQKAAVATQTAEITAQTESLKQEWGAAFEQNIAAMDRVIEKFGISDDQLVGLKGSMGAAGAAKFLHGISSKIGEHSFVSGGNAGGAIQTPAGAKTLIEMKMQDSEFRSRLLNRDVQATQEWEQLHKNLVGLSN